MNTVIAIAKNVIFFIGLVFSILLMGKRSDSIKKAAFGKIVDTDYHSNGCRY